MDLVDVGNGPPLVLIPGIQGRWEYLRPAIDALARSFRVLTFPLCGERGSLTRLDPSRGFDNDARQILEALDRSGIERALICGISFGGLPAIRFAASHPERTSGVVLASTPGPGWHLKRKHRLYMRAPWLFGPLFLVESPMRLRLKLTATFPHVTDRWRFARWQLATIVRAPLSPARMAARADLIESTDIVADCARVSAPTLIITGEPGLDRVVAVEGTLGYRPLIERARHVTLGSTGHLGSITRPEDFASLVAGFSKDPDQPSDVKQLQPTARLDAAPRIAASERPGALPEGIRN